MPIFLANFVLMDYGTGAVMAVPTHDQRDFEFAKKYDLPLKVVIQPAGVTLDPVSMCEAYTEAGIMTNSGQFNGLQSSDAKEAIADFLQSQGHGTKTVNFRLRDWGFHASATGAIRSRSSIATVAASYRYRKKICRSYFRKM